MHRFKKWLLAAVLAIGFGGVATAQDRPDTPWGSRPTTAETSATVGKVHSLAVRKVGGQETITWKMDVRIDGAKDRDCVVELELCNAAGQPFLRLDGSPVRLRHTVTPDSESFEAKGLAYNLKTDGYLLAGGGRVNGFYDLYGRGASEIFFRVTVKEDESGKVISRTGVIKVAGIDQVLATTPDRTDNPGLGSPQYRSVWGRLVFGRD